MTTEELLRTFCDAVERRNGKAFADLFADDSIYHDVFYGAARYTFSYRSTLPEAKGARAMFEEMRRHLA
jgi:hypothetical protein